MERRILHVDMDAFFASVEQLDRPELRGRPVLVGGSPDGRGVVCAASYEARPSGCRSAMPMSTAIRLCPQAIIVPVRMSRYRELSRRVFSLFDEFSPLVQPLSIDEAFLDLTGTEGVNGPAVQAARRLKERIRAETGLTASVGIAPNKFLAKLASELRKPDGLMVIEAGEVRQMLDPLPVERLWGVGAATLRRFHHLGLRTVADVRERTLGELTRELGSAGEHFFRLARGDDDRPVAPDREAKSISHETTFARDVADAECLLDVLARQVEDVAYRLRRHDLYARTFSLKLREGDFTTLTRAGTLPTAAHATDVLWQEARRLFERWREERPAPLRLLGFGASGLTGAEGRQLSLFADTDPRQERLDAAMDRLRERFGPDAVRRRPSRPTESPNS
jgi:DNA polymerase-4